MKKTNSQGFVLAETLVVAVFLMVIFGMLYSNFYPLVGEYEKREGYDDVDSKYAVYWLKKMIEDISYTPSTTNKQNLKNKKFMRFECSDVSEADDKRNTCKNLVNELEVDNCDMNGDKCEIFITTYNIKSFKDSLNTKKYKRFEETCSGNVNSCINLYVADCIAKDNTVGDYKAKELNCTSKAKKNIFSGAFEDYITALPDYTAGSLNNSKYRVIARFHHIKDENNYYSYATIEVNR